MDGHDDRDNVSGENSQPRDGAGRFLRTPESAQRDAEAIRMHVGGATYQEISDALGYGGKGNAYDAIKDALAKVPAEEVRELRRVSALRLDRLTFEAFAVLERDHVHISQGGKVVRDDGGNIVLDDGPKLAAIDRIVRVEERRSRLFGMDAPVRSKVDFGGDGEREAELRAMIERRRGAGTGGDGEPAGS